jgi:hypothetical protein
MASACTAAAAVARDDPVAVRGVRRASVDTPAAGFYGRVMPLGQRLLVGALLLASVGCAWLYRENRLLRNQLEALNDSTPATPASPASRNGQDAAGSAVPDTAETGPENEPKWRFAQRPRPTLEVKPEAEPEPEDRAERRQRRQAEMAAMFGRLDGETPEEYRERMVPFLQTALALPRQRVRDARRRAEDAAKVTDEQRAALDRVFEDVYQEALTLTDRAVAEGDLSPYRRNWAGALNYAGGIGAVLGAAEARAGEILDPTQQRILYEQGFEWGEYLGATVPWEQLQPPPPADH